MYSINELENYNVICDFEADYMEIRLRTLEYHFTHVSQLMGSSLWLKAMLIRSITHLCCNSTVSRPKVTKHLLRSIS